MPVIERDVECIKCGSQGRFYTFYGRVDKTCCKCRAGMAAAKRSGAPKGVTRKKNLIHSLKEYRRRQETMEQRQARLAMSTIRYSELQGRPERRQVVRRALIARANGRCEICQRTLFPDETHIDHDHATDAVRGILCEACNWGLGHFGDDIKTLLDAVRYLKSARLIAAVELGDDVVASYCETHEKTQYQSDTGSHALSG